MEITLDSLRNTLPDGGEAFRDAREKLRVLQPGENAARLSGLFVRGICRADGADGGVYRLETFASGIARRRIFIGFFPAGYIFDAYIRKGRIEAVVRNTGGVSFLRCVCKNNIGIRHFFRFFVRVGICLRPASAGTFRRLRGFGTDAPCGHPEQTAAHDIGCSTAGRRHDRAVGLGAARTAQFLRGKKPATKQP